MTIGILVVDDEPDVEDLIIQYFADHISREEYRFHFARTGEDALSFATAHPEAVDIALVDLNMPGMDGLALLEHLRSLNPLIKTAVVSAYGDMTNVRAAMNRGASDFVVKPVELLDLEMTVARLAESLLLFRETVRLKEDALLVRAEAEARDRAKTEFLAVMSHEIRTPMNGILGMIHLALDLSAEATQRDYLETALHSGEALLTILNDILDFSRLETGNLDFERRDFDLPQTVAGVVQLMAGRASERGLDLDHELAEGVPANAKGDVARLRQVLLNLVGNAIKFTEKGAIAVKVSKVADTGDGRALVRFAVSDTGIGIPPEARDKLFQSFTQADASISRRFGGSGLGLAICKRIVEAQGGTIGFASVQGQGSTFWFELPLEAAARVALERPCAAAPVLAPLDVLVAEDSLVNQKVAQGVLASRGHRVTIVDDGEKAVAMMRERAFDVVLMDMNMPHLDGLEATRRIRRMDSAAAEVPIIGLTAAVFEENLAACRAAGMNDVVGKPFDPPTLFATLARWAAPAGADQPREDAVMANALAPFREAMELLRDEMGPGMAGELLDMFLVSLDRLSPRAEAAIAAVDDQELSESVHALRGNALTLGLVELGDLCQDIESACREGDLPRALDHAGRLSGTIARTREFLAASRARLEEWGC